MQIRLRRLPHLWRDQDCLQLGTSPAVATVIRGLAPHDRAWLSRLAEGVDVQDAAGLGERPRALLDLLRGLGLLEPLAPVDTPSAAAVAELLSEAPGVLPLPADPDSDARAWGLIGRNDGYHLLRRRGDRRVRVLGQGRLPEAVTALLATAGVRAAATSTAFPDLVITIDAGAADAAAAAALVADDVPHLSVVAREADVVVGPLVLPGRTACLTCLDLHRADSDPAWPRLVRQLREHRLAATATETSLVAAAAGTAAGRALAHLDGLSPRPDEEPVAVTVELALGVDAVRVRRWLPHPACGCSWPPGGASPATEGPGVGLLDARVEAGGGRAADGARIPARAGRIGA